LYKVKKGKQERYVKDDAELNAYLLQLALDGSRLHVSKGAPTISDTGFEALAQEYMLLNLQFMRMERKINRDVLEAMVNLDPLNESDLSDKAKVTVFGESLIEELNAEIDETSRYRLAVHEDEALFGIKLIRRVHGNEREVVLDPSFFKSPDYRSIAKLAEKLNGMLEEGAFVARGEKESDVSSPLSNKQWTGY